jgi:hypothetical protein
MLALGNAEGFGLFWIPKSGIKEKIN